MNTTSNDILRFLDGSLTGEDEAELLHRLSVSPERREALRSHIQQAEMFERDRAAINVPYTAEQKLWTRLSEMMPAPQAFTTTAATIATQTVKQPGVSSWMSVAAVAVIGLLVGFGSGFFAAKETASTSLPISAPLALAAAINNTNVSANAEPTVVHNSARSSNTSRVFLQKTSAVSEAPRNDISVALNDATQTVAESSENSATPAATVEEEALSISAASALDISIGDLNIRNPRDEAAYQLNPLHNDYKTSKSFLQRFDILFSEAFGIQTPNTPATKVSFPVVTNSIISLSYQLFADENFYVGAGFGSTNMAKKNLILVNDISQNDNTLTADVSHAQAVWYGGFVQYRLPVSDRFAFTTTAGVSGSSLGLILSGELGSRLDLTDQVGLALGLRFSDLQYSLDSEINDIIKDQNNTPTGIVKDVFGTQSSQNYELTAGMYFHF